MFICKYCSKESCSRQGMTYHENRCSKNPNKVSFYWKGRKHSDEVIRKIGQNNRMGRRLPNSILDVSTRTTVKILKRLNIECSRCGWNEGTCDIHHIVPRKNGGINKRHNLTYICPNCHRLAHEGKIIKFKSLQEHIGDS